MSSVGQTTRSAVPVLALTALVLTGCGAGEDGAVGSASPTSSPPTSTPPTSSPTPSASPSEAPSGTPRGSSATSEPTEAPEPPEMVAYAGGEAVGFEVFSPADTTTMQGAPTSFKKFIARTIRDLVAGSTCDARSEVIVQNLRADGFATGIVDDCGGYRALWVQVDGRWTEVDRTQEMEGCAVLERYRVPSELVDGRCYDYDAQRERDYRQP